MRNFPSMKCKFAIYGGPGWAFLDPIKVGCVGENLREGVRLTVLLAVDQRLACEDSEPNAVCFTRKVKVMGRGDGGPAVS
jgi:hypothetical protein